MKTLHSLQRKRLSENVVGAIRETIFKGDLKLGQRLVETEPAERLSVSRGPIREALRVLASEGLVVINVHRGTFVMKPTMREVVEADLDFHARLVELARHKRLSQIWSAVHSQFRLCITAGMDEVREGNLDILAPDHAGIIKALQARALLVSHIERGARQVQKAIESFTD